MQLDRVGEEVRQIRRRCHFQPHAAAAGVLPDELRHLCKAAHAPFIPPARPDADPAAMPGFQYDSPAAALDAVRSRPGPVGPEELPAAHAAGRALAAPLSLGRDSPACDLSAMDGYALRRADLRPGVSAGLRRSPRRRAPAGLPGGDGRADLHRCPAAGRLRAWSCGARRCGNPRTRSRFPTRPRPSGRTATCGGGGENGRAGDPLAEAGATVTAALLAAAAACGATRLTVRRRVRVALLATGGEVLSPDRRPAPWQVRDANGPALAALLGRRPFLAVSPPAYAADDPAGLARTLAELIETHDAVLLTGGVSVGGRDHVRGAVEACGGRVAFHGLPIRPGKPILAATAGRTPVLGLPGNPVAALCTARRFAVPLLRTLAGFAEPDRVFPVGVFPKTERGADDGGSPLHRFLPVRLTAGGAEVISSRGSADTAAVAGSDGFVEVPPHEPARGPRPFRAW